MKKLSYVILPILFTVSCATSEKIIRAPANAEQSDYKVEIIGGDESTFAPNLNADATTISDSNKYDVVIIGGGLAGLTAAVYLTDAQLKVLVLEKESQVGGLAAEHMTANGIPYDRGAAYWTAPYKEELEILKRIELGNFEERYPIPEPIDTYLSNGTLYGEEKGLWDPETVKKLPVSFEIFKYELQEANNNAEIPNQPFEEFKGYIDPDNGSGKHGKMDLDRINAKLWIDSMPKLLAKHAKQKRPGHENESKFVEHSAQEIYDRFSKDSSFNSKDPMSPVIDFLELFCRSALGAKPDQISAMAFANFYISEIVTRYTTPIGTGKAARNMDHILKNKSHKDYADVMTNTPVPNGGMKITNDKSGVMVKYLKKDKMTGKWQHSEVKANYAVFAAQLKFAPSLIKDFKTSSDFKTRNQAKLMEQMEYSHYSVHVAEVLGHPYRASYDTWVRNQDYKDTDFTDIILGRWNEKNKINGYEKSKDCSINPDPVKNSIMTIYHPMAIKDFGPEGYSDKNSEKMARDAMSQMQEALRPVLRCDKDIKVLNVVTNRWPYSVHVAKPGHYIRSARLLRRPIAGRIFFANNNIGTPAFEEALFRGHCAADNILARTRKDFKREDWSRCPIDR